MIHYGIGGCPYDGMSRADYFRDDPPEPDPEEICRNCDELLDDCTCEVIEEEK